VTTFTSVTGVSTQISLATRMAIQNERVDTRPHKKVPWYIALVRETCTSGTEMTSPVTPRI